MSKRIYIQKLPIPENFKVPEVLENENFRIRPLKMKDSQKEYQATMANVDHINATRGVDYNAINHDITLEENTIHAAWAEYEFYLKSSFIFVVMSLDEEICLGEVYIYYSDKDEYDAEISMWVRNDNEFADTELRKQLYSAVKKWIREEWPFENPEFLGSEE